MSKDDLELDDNSGYDNPELDNIVGPSFDDIYSGKIDLVVWPKCHCGADIDAYVYHDGNAIGYCHNHYDIPNFPSWQPEKLSWYTKLWRKFFGWSGPKIAE